MKKLLFSVGLFCFALMNAGAQTTIMSENFETSKTAMPAGWSQQKAASDPSNLGWQFNNAVQPPSGYLATYYMAADGSYFAFINDVDNNTGPSHNYDTLYSPINNCSTYSHVQLAYEGWYVAGYYTSPPDTELATVAVSNDGGKTFATAARFPVGEWSTTTIDISKYAAGKSQVVVAFTYNDQGLNMLGAGVDNILMVAPLNYDLSVTSQNLPYLMQVGKAYTFKGTVNNYGGDSIVSMHLNYTVNGGPVQTDALTGIVGFNALTTYNFTHSINFTPAAAGNYKVKIWCDNLNGSNVDQKHSNDTLVAYFMAIDSVKPRVALYEEVVGQSCYYCMLASPNVDSVTTNNPSALNILHYHVPYPTTPDYMWSENQTLATYYETYYSVSGTPTGMLDGVSLYPGALAAPNDLNSPIVRQENAVGSPFTINITSFTYDPLTMTYSASYTIESYATFGAGLIARAAISNDSLIYTVDYSGDDPPSSFAPPIGTGSTQDYLYQYTMHFPSVVEDMMGPSANNTAGNALAAFTPMSSQSFTYTWKKNHAWSLDVKTYPYDSAADRLTVFVQTNTAMAASGVPAKYVFQSASKPATIVTGMQQLSDEVEFNMYPNPTTNATNITYSLTKSQNVSIEVYNMLGEKVYSVDNGMMGAGEHMTSIDCSTYLSGVYFVRFTTDNTTTTRRLVIQK